MKKTILASLMGLVLSGAVMAESAITLTQFQPGTPARASEVNGNFQALQQALETALARIDQLEQQQVPFGPEVLANKTLFIPFVVEFKLPGDQTSVERSRLTLEFSSDGYMVNASLEAEIMKLSGTTQMSYYGLNADGSAPVNIHHSNPSVSFLLEMASDSGENRTLHILLDFDKTFSVAVMNGAAFYDAEIFSTYTFVDGAGVIR